MGGTAHITLQAGVPRRPERREGRVWDGSVSGPEVALSAEMGTTATGEEAAPALT